MASHLSARVVSWSIGRRRPAGTSWDPRLEPQAAGEAPAARTVSVNVFNGSERSLVEMRVDGGAWQRLERVVAPYPGRELLYQRDSKLKRPYRSLSRPGRSAHLWQGSLPAGLAPGQRRIEVRTTDMFGATHTARHTLKVE